MGTTALAAATQVAANSDTGGFAATYLLAAVVAFVVGYVPARVLSNSKRVSKFVGFVVATVVVIAVAALSK